MRRLHALLFLLFVTHILYASLIGISNDEAYYWTWAQTPSWGYYDHPPMVAFLIFGDSILGVRGFAVISSILSSYLIYYLTRSFWAAIAYQATLIIGVFSIFMTPDSPLMFFWLLTLVFVKLTDKHKVYWLLVGASIGLAFLSKYTAVFLGFGVVFYVIFQKDKWHHLKSPYLYLGAIIAFIVISPNIYWNYTHDWLTFSKQGGLAFVASFNPYHFAEFFAAQFLLFTPLIAILVMIGFKNVKQNSLSFYTSLPLLIMLIYKSLFDKVEGNWAFALLPALIIMADSVKNYDKLKFYANVTGLFIGNIMLALIVLRPFNLPPNITDQLYGWEDNARIIAELHKISVGKGIATNSYAMNAQLRYHLRDTDIWINQLSERERYYHEIPKGMITHIEWSYFYIVEEKQKADFKKFQLYRTIPRIGGDIHIYIR